MSYANDMALTRNPTFHWAGGQPICYPNGDLLVVLQHRKNAPYGFALVKIDKDSRLVWVNLENAHHDVIIGEDGLIYSIGQEVRKDEVPGLDTLKPPFLEDFVLVISQDGRTFTAFQSWRRLPVLHLNWQ